MIETFATLFTRSHLTMSLIHSSSVRCVALLAALCLALPVAQAQNNAALSSAPTDYPVNVPGAEIRLGTSPYEGDLAFLGAGGTLVLDPGQHSVTGNVTINAPGETILVGFDKDKLPGSLEVGGSLVLGPDNAPTLALDLSLVGNFVVGETFSIMRATRIEGHFSGLGEGDSFEMGDIKLRINYSNNTVLLTVISPPKRWDRDRTPVIEMDNSLIDPTSTAPGGW